MRFLTAGAIAAALVLVTGAAARAGELMTLRKGAMVAQYEFQLDEACEMLRDEDKEALMDMADRGLIVFTQGEVQVYVSDAVERYTAKIRIKGKPGYFYTRRYNLQEGGI